jgi:hypothetical protein
MQYEINRFDLLTVFKVSFLVYLVVGFLIGILYSLIIVQILMMMGPMLESPVFDDFGSIGFMGAVTLAIFMAIFMAVVWSIITVIAAGIYNLIAGWVGGLKLELNQVAVYYTQPPVAQQPAPQPPPKETGGAGV